MAGPKSRCTALVCRREKRSRSHGAQGAHQPESGKQQRTVVGTSAGHTHRAHFPTHTHTHTHARTSEVSVRTSSEPRPSRRKLAGTSTCSFAFACLSLLTKVAGAESVNHKPLAMRTTAEGVRTIQSQHRASHVRGECHQPANARIASRGQHRDSHSPTHTERKHDAPS